MSDGDPRWAGGQRPADLTGWFFDPGRKPVPGLGRLDGGPWAANCGERLSTPGPFLSHSSRTKALTALPLARYGGKHQAMEAGPRDFLQRRRAMRVFFARQEGSSTKFLCFPGM